MADDHDNTTIIRLNVLGSLELRTPDRTLKLPKNRAAQRMLALFAVKKQYGPEDLVDILWPGRYLDDDRKDEADAVRGVLQRAFSDARAALGLKASMGVLRPQAGSYHRTVEGSAVTITSDLEEFRQLARPDNAPEDWRAALALVRGPIAQHLPVKNTRTDWLERERTAQRREIEAVLEQLDRNKTRTSSEIETQIDDLLEGRHMQSPAVASSSGSGDTSSEPAKPDPDVTVPSPPTSKLDASTTGHRWLAKRYVATGLATTLLVLAGIVLLVRADRSTSIPPEGSVINADTGDIVNHPQVVASPLPAQLAFGSIFRACDLSAKSSCGGGHVGPTPIKVKVGDIVAFRVELNDGFSKPIHYLKLIGFSHKRVLVTDARTRPEKTEPSQMELGVNISIKWPEVLGEHEIVNEPGLLGHRTSGAPPNEAIYLQLPHPGHYRLVYIPGSTTLVDKETHFFHPLPDGIMGNGIELEDVGPPPSCFWCAQQYIRYVYFHTRVTDTSE
jgi:hypothetical protein